MNLQLDEEQQLLKNSARDFLEMECPTSLVRLMETDEVGFPADLWRKMSDLGWPGFPFDEAYGGVGGNLITLAVLLEELGRVCDPTPYFSSVVVGGLTIGDAGSEAQKEAILPRLSNGTLLITLALVEGPEEYSPKGITANATRSGDGFVINGKKLFVENAHIADYVLTAVRTSDDRDQSKGITLFLVDKDAPGLSLKRLSTIAGDRQYEVLFDGVEVPPDRVVGEPDNAWPLLSNVINRSAALQCAAQVGNAKKVLDLTIDYVNMRIQFGRQIGSFQAVQHNCANMWMDVEAAWLATYEAIWRLSEGLPADEQISIAKAWTGDANTRVCLTAHQLHGGVGFMQEYDLQLWTRRAKAMELKWGTPRFHRKKLAGML